MRKILACMALFTIAFTYTKAQTPKSSLLWEISGNGLKQPSWIFGTFHIICKDDFYVSDMLKNKIKTAKAFYGELKLDDPTMATTAMQKMMMPDRSLEAMIGERYYSAVSDSFSSIMGPGGSLKMYDHFKPFLPLTMLLTRTVTCNDPLQPETEFVKIAKEYNLPVKGLETVSDQLDVIDKQPLDSQVVEFRKSVLNFDSVKIMMKQMLRIYKLNNIDSVYGFVKASNMDSQYEIDMILDRNKKWILLIEKASADESVFYAVGAGHLGGAEGVINLLRKRGYRLTPVKY